MRTTVVVVGSANMDIVAHAPRIPGVGETLIGTTVEWLPGGKGLNQACAAGAVYAPVRFLGAVGTDDNGTALLGRLTEYGVDTSGVIHTGQSVSGTAHITVDDSGENSIVVISGANALLTPQHAEGFFSESAADFQGCVTVLQGEVPFATSLRAAELTSALGGRVVVNLAPAASGQEELLSHADPLVVNEYEAGILLERSAPKTWEEAEGAATNLLALSASVIVTLGPIGSVVASRATGQIRLERIEATEVEAVDSTGAGDAFVGVLAAAMAAGTDLFEAARLASVAAGLTVTLPGASQSYTALEGFQVM